VSSEQHAHGRMVAPPLSMFDAAPICDGAAAVVLCGRKGLRSHHRPIRIAGSAVATDTIGLAARSDLSRLTACELSARRAFLSARQKPQDMDLAELHDAFTIMTALSLEACGFAPDGEATTFAREGRISLNGSLPISTFGGLKARGHPVGASGTYQIVEACLQLRGEGGPNQVAGAKRALTQSIGGHGAVAVTHILES
jgi:acetyl-CoA C-acetyltransferase